MLSDSEALSAIDTIEYFGFRRLDGRLISICHAVNFYFIYEYYSLSLTHLIVVCDIIYRVAFVSLRIFSR